MEHCAAQTNLVMQICTCGVVPSCVCARPPATPDQSWCIAGNSAPTQTHPPQNNNPEQRDGVGPGGAKEGPAAHLAGGSWVCHLLEYVHACVVPHSRACMCCALLHHRGRQKLKPWSRGWPTTAGCMPSRGCVGGGGVHAYVHIDCNAADGRTPTLTHASNSRLTISPLSATRQEGASCGQLSRHSPLEDTHSCPPPKKNTYIHTPHTPAGPGAAPPS